MPNSCHLYRGFTIEIYSSKAKFLGLWNGHFKISKTRHGIAAAMLGGPYFCQEDAVENALRTAKQFVDNLAG